MFEFSIQLLPEIFLILRRIQRDVNHKYEYMGLHISHLLFL